MEFLSYEEFKKKYPMTNLLNQGMYSKVYHVQDPRYIVKCGEMWNLGIELDILQRCHHPNIIRPLSMAFDFTHSKLWIAYHKGEASLTKKELNIEQLCEELIDAIKYLHDNSIVHGDIKPDNIIFINNKPILIDFGLAKYTVLYETQFLSDENKITYIDKIFKGTAYTRGFNSPFFIPDAYNSILNDWYALGKTIEALLLKTNVYFSNIPLSTDNPRINELLSLLLFSESLMKREIHFDGIMYPGYKSIQKLNKFLEPSLVIREFKKPSKPELFLQKYHINILDYYIEVQNFFEDLIKISEVDLHIIFLTFHNIHKVINFFKPEEYSRLFWCIFFTSLMVCDYVDSELMKHVCNRFIGSSMEYMYHILIKSLKILGFSIYDITYWNMSNSHEELIYLFEETLKHNYIFPLKPNTASKPPKNNIDFNTFYKTWKEHNQIQYLGGIYMYFKTKGREISNFEVKPFLPVITKENYIIYLVSRKYKISLEDDLALLFLIIDMIKNNKIIINKILHEIVNYKSSNSFKSKMYHMYDIIFGTKIKELKGFNLCNSSLNTFYETPQKIMEDLKNDSISKDISKESKDISKESEDISKESEDISKETST